jgi:hypothetical protein
MYPILDLILLAFTIVNKGYNQTDRTDKKNSRNSTSDSEKILKLTVLGGPQISKSKKYPRVTEIDHVLYLSLNVLCSPWNRTLLSVPELY